MKRYYYFFSIILFFNLNIFFTVFSQSDNDMPEQRTLFNEREIAEDDLKQADKEEKNSMGKIKNKKNYDEKIKQEVDIEDVGKFVEPKEEEKIKERDNISDSKNDINLEKQIALSKDKNTVSEKKSTGNKQVKFDTMHNASNKDDDSIKKEDIISNYKGDNSDKSLDESHNLSAQLTANKRKKTENLNSKEYENALVKNAYDANAFKNFLNKSKILNKEINSIVDNLRSIRLVLNDKYNSDIYVALDNILQQFGFKHDSFTGKERFSFLRNTVKKEYRKEWDSLKSKIDALDKVEDLIFEKLKNLNYQYDKAVQISIEARKMNMNIFELSDLEKLKDIVARLEIKKDEVIKIKEKIVNNIKQKLDFLINQAVSNLNGIKTEFDALKKRGENLSISRKTLEKTKELVNKAIPQRRVLNLSIVDKIKGFWKNLTNKFFSFIEDIKNKTNNIKREKLKALSKKG